MTLQHRKNADPLQLRITGHMNRSQTAWSWSSSLRGLAWFCLQLRLSYLPCAPLSFVLTTLKILCSNESFCSSALPSLSPTSLLVVCDELIRKVLGWFPSIVLGTIPILPHSVEGSLPIVLVINYAVDGVLSQRDMTLRVFLGAMAIFSVLGNKCTGLSLLRVFGTFSWPHVPCFRFYSATLFVVESRWFRDKEGLTTHFFCVPFSFIRYFCECNSINSDDIIKSIDDDYHRMERRSHHVIQNSLLPPQFYRRILRRSCVVFPILSCRGIV